MCSLSVPTTILKTLETSSSIGMFVRDTGGCLISRLGLSRSMDEAKEISFAEISESLLFYFSAPALAKASSGIFAKQAGIKIFDKPSTPCIATRFPYGTTLSEDLINKVKAGENLLKATGFSRCRLRLHQDIARIEIPSEDFYTFLEIKDKIVKDMKELGFKYITLDLEGLRSGSMDI